jgi:hypothetical protein
MANVRVPRTPKSSFDKNRRPSALLLDQIKHLEWAALPASHRKPRHLARQPKVKTEAQAAERIAQLTAIVLKAKDDGAPPATRLPPVPNVPSSAPKRRLRREKRRPRGRRR